MLKVVVWKDINCSFIAGVERIVFRAESTSILHLACGVAKDIRSNNGCTTVDWHVLYLYSS